MISKLNASSESKVLGVELGILITGFFLVFLILDQHFRINYFFKLLKVSILILGGQMINELASIVDFLAIP